MWAGIVDLWMADQAFDQSAFSNLSKAISQKRPGFPFAVRRTTSACRPPSNRNRAPTSTDCVDERGRGQCTKANLIASAAVAWGGCPRRPVQLREHVHEAFLGAH